MLYTGSCEGRGFDFERTPDDLCRFFDDAPEDLGCPNAEDFVFPNEF
jgi:hypothetical protein